MKNPDQQMDAILITGPTASGKSALALSLARQHDGVVINADSMQVYDVLRVLTARPSDDEMAGIPHHLYGHVDPRRSYSTGEWLRETSALLADLKDQGRMPVIVGGTGLYFKALTGGLSDMPEIPAKSASTGGHGLSRTGQPRCMRSWWSVILRRRQARGRRRPAGGPGPGGA